MSWWQAIILGLVQGVTEFLPISSSAHLALVPHWLGWRLPRTETFIFDVLVQVATLAAVVGYYRVPLSCMARSLWRDLRTRTTPGPDTRLALLLLLATLPGAVAGLLIKDAVETAFSRPHWVAGFLVGTAGLMALAEVLGRRQRSMHALTWWEALLIGGFQALALFPGVSRSGATISGAMLLHLKREDAAHFSFLLAVPIMTGAGLMALKDLFALPQATVQALAAPFLLGFAVAGLSGYAAIRFLLGFLRRHSLWGFVVYCLAVALFTWVWV